MHRSSFVLMVLSLPMASCIVFLLLVSSRPQGGGRPAPGREPQRRTLTVVLEDGTRVEGEIVRVGDGIQVHVRGNHGAVPGIPARPPRRGAGGDRPKATPPPRDEALPGPKPAVQVSFEVNRGGIASVSWTPDGEGGHSSGGLADRGSGLAWKAIADALEKPLRAAPIGAGFEVFGEPAGSRKAPTRIRLSPGPDPGTCAVWVGAESVGSGDAAIVRAREQLLRRGERAAEAFDTILDADPEVPAVWVMRTCRGIGPAVPWRLFLQPRVLFRTQPDFEAAWEKMAAIRRSIEGSDAPMALMKFRGRALDLAVSFVVSEDAPFERVLGLAMLCGRAGIQSFALGTSEDELVGIPPMLNPRPGPASAEDEPAPAEPSPKGDCFGSRFDVDAAVQRSEASPESVAAVARGLRWLARHQDPDGTWSCGKFARHCRGGPCAGPGSVEAYDVGVTGLALLAFLGAGHTPDRGEFRDAVENGLRALTNRQDEDGCFGPRTGDGHWIYNHAICTLAAVEAHGLWGKSALLEHRAKKAVEFLVGCQNPGAGWRYGVQPGESDTCCTGWAVHALKAAALAGLPVPPECFKGAMAWFEEATDETYYQVGYTRKGDTGQKLVEAAAPLIPKHSTTAAAVFGRIAILGPKSKNRPECLGGGNLVKCNPQKWDAREGGMDFHYWYWGTLTMFQLGGTYWRTWNATVQAALLPNQARAGCAAGSWDPVDAWGPEAGRVYSTAMGVLTLETPYRYKRFQD
jgi:hypothetical protein